MRRDLLANMTRQSLNQTMLIVEVELHLLSCTTESSCAASDQHASCLTVPADRPAPAHYGRHRVSTVQPLVMSHWR